MKINIKTNLKQRGTLAYWHVAIPEWQRVKFWKDHIPYYKCATCHHGMNPHHATCQSLIWTRVNTFRYAIVPPTHFLFIQRNPCVIRWSDHVFSSDWTTSCHVLCLKWSTCVLKFAILVPHYCHVVCHLTATSDTMSNYMPSYCLYLHMIKYLPTNVFVGKYIFTYT